ncbi:AraC family transcriptional regulator, partial [Paenibacillus sp. 28ISP30-2]|nr:AraC family transcriptional regulator [Paenibacillus sp. 28ISP30-2]
MYRLLIVDDEYHIREGLKLMVAESGLPVEGRDVAGEGEMGAEERGGGGECR